MPLNLKGVIHKLLGSPKYTARIDKLRMCESKCGLAIGAAYGPQCTIHVVMCCIAGAVGQATCGEDVRSSAGVSCLSSNIAHNVVAGLCS